MPAVFLPQRVTLKDGEKPEALEVRAVPHVVIEARYLDSKGKDFRLFLQAAGADDDEQARGRMKL